MATNTKSNTHVYLIVCTNGDGFELVVRASSDTKLARISSLYHQRNGQIGRRLGMEYNGHPVDSMLTVGQVVEMEDGLKGGWDDGMIGLRFV